MSRTRNRKNRGRPPGSPNRDYQQVETERIPAQCIKCDGLRIKRLPGTKTVLRSHSGMTRSGLAYQSYRQIRCICEDCGQHVLVKEFSPLTRDEQIERSSPGERLV